MSVDNSRRSSMSSLFAHSYRPPRYPGEDTRPTSQKELAGWYAYAFAAEVYVICGELLMIFEGDASLTDNFVVVVVVVL